MALEPTTIAIRWTAPEFTVPMQADARLDSEPGDPEPATLTPPKKRARVKFTEEEESVLQEFCKDSGKSSLSEARKFLELHPMNRTLKQVQDKVKQLLL